jgi:hypothetical protein
VCARKILALPKSVTELVGKPMKEQETKSFDSNLIKCRFCSCLFVTVYDLDCHIAAFGVDKEEHLYNFDRARKLYFSIGLLGFAVVVVACFRIVNCQVFLNRSFSLQISYNR